MMSTAQSIQRFGIHVSIAGGIEKAFPRGEEVGCDTMQVFVKNQKQWKAKPLTDQTISAYKDARKQSKIKPVIAHAGYLINLGSPKNEQWNKSIDAAVDELERCEALDIPQLVIHPGNHMKEGIDAGIKRIANGLNEAHKRTRGFKTQLALETTAGQGTSVGHEVEHLGRIINAVKNPERLTVCLDTCHLFAAGYDITDHDEYEKLINTLAEEVGLNRIKCIHMNDSKTPCGSHVDRHDHIGEGKIGLDGFRRLICDKRLVKVPRILETPQETNESGDDLDKINLKALRKLASSC